MVSTWDASATGYARSLARLCAGAIPAVLSEIADAPGRRLLDAGSGTGELCDAAALDGFDVLGIDSSGDMVSVARQLHPGLRFERADLIHLPFADETFDAVTSNFVVNHTVDPRKSLHEIHRVLGHRGVAVVTVWPYRVSPLNLLWGQVIAQSGAKPPAIARLPPDKDFERTGDGLAGLLAECGFANRRAREIDVTLTINPADLWAGAEAGIGTIGAAFEQQDVHMRRAMADTFRALVEPHTRDGLLTFAATAILAAGRRT